jgi:hypothetical protein
MPLAPRLSVVAAIAVLAGCASAPNIPANPPGKHLVYWDSNGNAIRQFDYPDDKFCRKVESVAGRAARCQAGPVPGLQARATLRYTPPGVLVQGHYADMARCRADTSSMSPGVELINGCSTQ